MLRSRLAVLAAVVAGTSLFVGGAAHAAGTVVAQQVCAAASIGGGEACFYAGRFFTGPEFDISIPLTLQLPVESDGSCTDLPTGIGLAGSVTNASGDTLYVLPVSCPDSRPGTRPAAIVLPHSSGNVLVTASDKTVSSRASGTHSVRMCGADLELDPITLSCVFPR